MIIEEQRLVKVKLLVLSENPEEAKKEYLNGDFIEISSEFIKVSGEASFRQPTELEISHPKIKHWYEILNNAKDRKDNPKKKKKNLIND